MNGLTLLGIAVLVLGSAYKLYGGYLCKTWGIDENAKTPAYELEDGVDYVPADTQVVFGHQFASIAGAGPINGPIQAAAFGWLPILLWVLIGGVFIGAVQDFVSMYASVKNKGRTIGYIIEEYIGKTGKKLFLLFCWLFSILVVAAFADIVASTFHSLSADFATSGIASNNDIANGSVATTSALFLLEAIVLGCILRFCKFGKWVNTAIALCFLIIGTWIGLTFPILGVSANTWHYIVFAYIIVACIAPVWILLQPRDYLNSYLLIFMMAAAILGVVVANPTIEMNAFNGFYTEGLGNMFPILFVTIACGAVSGFHSLVSSGTSSKQIKNEKNMLPVSFGAMLLECGLAIIALIAVASLVPGSYSGTPSQIFATAISGFLSNVGLPTDVIYTLINLSISAFALTSLDSVARVGRLSFQEFFLDADIDENNMGPIRKFFTNKYVATMATLIFAYALCKIGYANIWPLFGSANQLLSALSLIACAVFLKKTKRKGFMLIIPTFVMLGVTFTALTQILVAKSTALFTATSTNLLGDSLQLVFGTLLLGLGIMVALQGFHKLTTKETTTAS